MLNYYKQNYPRAPYTEDTSPVVKVKAPVLMIHWRPIHGSLSSVTDAWAIHSRVICDANEFYRCGRFNCRRASRFGWSLGLGWGTKPVSCSRPNVRDAHPGEGDGYFVVLSLNSSTNLRTRLISAPPLPAPPASAHLRRLLRPAPRTETISARAVATAGLHRTPPDARICLSSCVQLTTARSLPPFPPRRIMMNRPSDVTS